MIRGLQKKIIVMESPNPEIFEQAIFIVRDDVADGGRLSREQILLQARKVADAYVMDDVPPQTRSKKKFLYKLPSAVYAAFAAIAAAAAWVAAKFVGV